MDPFSTQEGPLVWNKTVTCRRTTFQSLPDVRVYIVIPVGTPTTVLVRRVSK